MQQENGISASLTVKWMKWIPCCLQYYISIRLMWLRLCQRGWHFGPGGHGNFQNYQCLQFVQSDNATGDYKLGFK